MDRHPCKLCSESFDSEIQLLLHFKNQHLTSNEANGDDDDEQMEFSDNDDESSGSDAHSETGSDTAAVDFLTDLERSYLRQSRFQVEAVEDEEDEEEEETSQNEELENDEDEPPKRLGSRSSRAKNENVQKEFKKEKKKSNLDSARAPFSCKTCSKSYAALSSLKIHVASEGHTMAKVRNKKPYLCSVCSSRFPTPSTLNRHMRSHEKRTFKCEFCIYGNYTRRDELAKHVAQFHPEQIYLCKECPKKKFLTPESLEAHEMLHKYVAKTRSLMKKAGHETNSDLVDKRRFLCPVCNSKWPTISKLKRHEKTHGDDPQVFKCTFCEETFDKDKCKQLIKHVESQHLNKVGEFKCEVCEKSFDYKSNLTRHLKLHEKTKQMQHDCDLCTKSFTRLEKLQEHKMKVHKNVAENTEPEEQARRTSKRIMTGKK